MSRQFGPKAPCQRASTATTASVIHLLVAYVVLQAVLDVRGKPIIVLIDAISSVSNIVDLEFGLPECCSCFCDCQRPNLIVTGECATLFRQVG